MASKKARSGISYNQQVPEESVAVVQGHQNPRRTNRLGGIRNATPLCTADAAE